MNNLVYLILRYLKEEGIQYTSKFDAFEGVEIIQWSWTNSNGFSTSFEIIVFQDSVRVRKVSGNAYAFSEEVQTYGDFRQILN